MTIALRQFKAGALPGGHQEALIAAYRDAYREQLDDPFVQRFEWFAKHWTGRPGYTCVMAFEDDEVTGYSYGAPLDDGREWWRNHYTPDGAADTSTFAVSEVLVRPAWRKLGIAEKTHEALLADRPEALAVLYVDTDKPRVQVMYERWGYNRVGEHRPFEDAPLYSVMVRQLR